ncbi:MAG: hypothetical protein ACKOBG_01315 [Actinomycetota bacterium]
MTAVPLSAATLRPAPHPVVVRRQARPRPARRPSPAVLRRRRLLAALVGLGLVLTVARAGVALAGSSVPTSERLPHERTVIVEPGDTLWAIAAELAPERDRREVVDAIAEARGSTVLMPGEAITWLDA